jgi:hypothetical protein
LLIVAAVGLITGTYAVLALGALLCAVWGMAWAVVDVRERRAKS